MDERLDIEARRRYILDQLSRQGRVRVSDLSRMLSISEVTIRNDLKVLEISGRLERVPGGAVATLDHFLQGGYRQRKTKNAEQKKIIGDTLSEHVHDGEIIMINSGTTSLLAAIALKKHRNLNILTNSIAVALELGAHPTTRVILLGGKINAQYGFTFGSDTVTQLSRYKADKAILSVDGITIVNGLTTYHAEEAEINQAMMSRSDQVMIAADSSKLGRESFINFASLEGGQTLVTDAEADYSIVQELRAVGVTVLMSDDKR